MVKNASVIMFLASLMIVVGIISASELLLSMFGDEFVSAQTALYLLGLGMFTNAIHGLGEHILNMFGNERKLTLVFATGLVINVILNALLIPQWGVNGAAFATMSSTIIWNIIAGIVVKRELDVTIVNVFATGLLSMLRTDEKPQPSAA